MISVTQSLQLIYFLEIGRHTKTGLAIFQTRSLVSLFYWAVLLFPITAVQHHIRIRRLLGVIMLILSIGQSHPEQHFGLQPDSMGHHLQFCMGVCHSMGHNLQFCMGVCHSNILCIHQARQLALLTM
jgi:hypothetical protein